MFLLGTYLVIELKTDKISYFFLLVPIANFNTCIMYLFLFSNSALRNALVDVFTVLLELLLHISSSLTGTRNPYLY